MGLLALQQNKLEEAEAYFQQGLNVCEELGDLPGISGHYQGLGMVYLQQQRLAEAEDILKKGIEIEERLQRDTVAHHYGVLGSVYSQTGRFDEAEAMYRRTLAIQRKLGHKQFEARALGGLGQVLLEKGDTPEATALFQQAKALFDAIGDDKGQAIQATVLGNSPAASKAANDAPEGLVALYPAGKATDADFKLSCYRKECRHVFHLICFRPAGVRLGGAV